MRCDLEHLERLERLERLQHLERLQRLEFTTMDYRDYAWREGDVVYCDPPYESKNERYYGMRFDTGAFYDWVATRDYPVYFSSYGISDTGFAILWERPATTRFCATDNAVRVTERLYGNRHAEALGQVRLF